MLCQVSFIPQLKLTYVKLLPVDGVWFELLLLLLLSSEGGFMLIVSMFTSSMGALLAGTDVAAFRRSLIFMEARLNDLRPLVERCCCFFWDELELAERTETADWSSL